ncbi:hypothetical protein [Thiocapsa sp.]|uniref:hypothetical protein n=1 Tax=Thiocapsa sp. TaxID=2024551 RepID=UPI003593476F
MGGGERPARQVGIARAIALVIKAQGGLEGDIQGADAEAAVIHRGEDLDVANRVEPEACRDTLEHHREQPFVNPIDVSSTAARSVSRGF